MEQTTGFKQQVGRLVRTALERQRAQMQQRVAADKALESEPANVARAEAVMADLLANVATQASRHDLVNRPTMSVPVMRLAKSDYRHCGNGLGLRGLDQRKRDAFCRSLTSLKGVAALVADRCRGEGLKAYIVQAGTRPGYDDAGYEIYIDVSAIDI